MDNSTETLVTSGLNAVTMVTFAIPGGAPVGIALTVGTLLFELFFPPSQPPTHPITANELKEALDSLKTELIDAIWQGKADDISDHVLALHQGFVQLFGEMGKLQVDDKQYVPSETSDTIRYFTADTYRYFNLQDPNGVLTKLRSFRNVLEGHSLNDTQLTQTQLMEHKTRTIGLYALIGSLTASYLGAAVMWKWGRELLVAYQYQQYQAALAQWKDDNGTDPTPRDRREIARKYPGVNTNPSYTPPNWNDWIQQANCPVPRLIGEVQLMVNYCIGTADDLGLFTTMNYNLDQIEKKAVDGDNFPSSTVGIWKQHMKDAFVHGAARVAWLESLEAQYGLSHVSEDDLESFQEAIQAWIDGAGLCNFTAYTVQPKDTFGSILARFPAYSPSTNSWSSTVFYAYLIINGTPGIQYVGASPGPPYDQHVVDCEPVPGTILKIFASPVGFFFGSPV